jgi:hypothetical protein
MRDFVTLTFQCPNIYGDSPDWLTDRPTDRPTDQLIPWGIVLLEKLVVTQLVRKFPAFYGTRRFTIVFTTARHWSISWTRCFHFAPCLFKIHFNIIVPQMVSSFTVQGLWALTEQWSVLIYSTPDFLNPNLNFLLLKYPYIPSKKVWAQIVVVWGDFGRLHLNR